MALLDICESRRHSVEMDSDVISPAVHRLRRCISRLRRAANIIPEIHAIVNLVDDLY